MGNLIFGYNFVDYGNGNYPTASSESSYFYDDNLLLYRYPNRKWQGTVQTNSTIVGDMASAKALSAIVLADVNFTACYIQGNATDSWGAPSFRYPAAGNLTISKDERTQRLNVYIPTSGFNYQFFRIYIPTQSSTDGLGFRIGTVVALNTALTLSENPSYGMDYSADAPMETNEAGDDLMTGDREWQGSFGFDRRNTSVESDLWTLNSIDKSAPVVIYENLGDTSKVYIARRRTGIKASWAVADLKNFERITYREIRNNASR